MSGEPKAPSERLKRLVSDSGQKVEFTQESVQLLTVIADAMQDLEHKMDAFIARTTAEDERSKDCCKQLLSPERVRADTLMHHRVNTLWVGAVWLLSTIGAGVLGGILYYSGISGK